MSEWTKLSAAAQARAARHANLRLWLESGYGQVQADEDGGPTLLMYGLGVNELEAMGADERTRLGVEEMYQRALAYAGTLGA